MAEPVPFPPPGFDDLSSEEKHEYVQALQERIGAGSDDESVPEWHWQVIEERLAAHRAHPERVVPWDEAEEAIRSRLRERAAAR